MTEKIPEKVGFGSYEGLHGREAVQPAFLQRFHRKTVAKQPVFVHNKVK